MGYNNEFKCLDFEDWIAGIENDGLIGNMLSTFNLNQIMEILNNWDDDHIMTIHEATPVKTLKAVLNY